MAEVSVVYPDWETTDQKIKGSSDYFMTFISFNCLKEDVMEFNTHSYATDSLWEVEKEMGRWWRSEDTVLSENPYTGFQTRKDWPLKEAINMHFARLQQENGNGDPLRLIT